MDDIPEAGSLPPVSLSLDQFSSIRGGVSVAGASFMANVGTVFHGGRV